MQIDEMGSALGYDGVIISIRISHAELARTRFSEENLLAAITEKIQEIISPFSRK